MREKKKSKENQEREGRESRVKKEMKEQRKRGERKGLRENSFGRERPNRGREREVGTKDERKSERKHAWDLSSGMTFKTKFVPSLSTDPTFVKCLSSSHL